MRCTSCGSEIGNNIVCPICGCQINANQTAESNSSPIYTGSEQVNAPTHTRSKKMALFLACIGGNDLYLFEWSRFVKKMVVCVCTCTIGYIIWQTSDIIRIANGSISHDANGTPLV